MLKWLHPDDKVDIVAKDRSRVKRVARGVNSKAISMVEGATPVYYERMECFRTVAWGSHVRHVNSTTSLQRYTSNPSPYIPNADNSGGGIVGKEEVTEEESKGFWGTSYKAIWVDEEAISIKACLFKRSGIWTWETRKGERYASSNTPWCDVNVQCVKGVGKLSPIVIFTCEVSILTRSTLVSTLRPSRQFFRRMHTYGS